MIHRIVLDANEIGQALLRAAAEKTGFTHHTVKSCGTDISDRRGVVVAVVSFEVIATNLEAKP